MAESPPIHLTVCCPDPTGRADVVARLRGATVEGRADLSHFRPVAGRGVMLIGIEAVGVEELLRAGSDVLLVPVRPPTPETAERLFGTAREAGVRFVAANPDRHLPSRRLVRQQIPDAIGAPGLLRIHRWEPAAAPPAGTTPLPAPLLRDLDVALWLFGGRPDRVFAVGQDSGAYVQLHLGFPDGGMALLDYDARLPSGDGYQSLSVIAANGAAYADDHANTQLAFRGGHPRAVRTGEGAGLLAAVAQEFVDAIRAGREPMAENERSWRDVFAAADAVRDSLATGRAAAVGGR